MTTTLFARPVRPSYREYAQLVLAHEKLRASVAAAGSTARKRYEAYSKRLVEVTEGTQT
jgi:hypothetical protein